MSKKAAAQAVADAELRALVAEQDARHAVTEERDRQERQRLFAQFRQELARDRLEAQAQAVEAQGEATTAAVTPPRDQATGRWLPAASEPEPEPEPAVDLSTLSMAEYSALRGQLGIDKAGVEHVGRAPGHERSEFLGHRIEDGSGFGDWRDYTQNNRVFRSQLPDSKRQTPVGYQRPDTGEWS